MTTPLYVPTVEKYLWGVPGERGNKVREFHTAHLDRFNAAWGSSNNHQAWPGGYRDHLTQMLDLGETLINRYMDYGHDLAYPSWPSFVVVVYYHDIEKMFKYSDPRQDIYKEGFLRTDLRDKWGVELTEEEMLAIRYAHGEGEDYRKDMRVMSPLGAWLHAADTLSSRWLYDRTILDSGLMVPHKGRDNA